MNERDLAVHFPGSKAYSAQKQGNITKAESV